MFTLRDYQQDLIEEVFTAWAGGIKKLLLQLSTGGGKTIIFVAIAQRAAAKLIASKFIARSERVLVVAHREELILQAAEKLAAVTGIEPGIIKAGYKSTESFIQVGSIQTLARRKSYPEAQLVIVDEAHHASAASYRKLLNAYPEALVLGVTATPRREDGYGFRDVFDHLICSITTRELISLGHLSDYKLIAGFTYSQHKVPQNRDFTKKELEQVACDYKPSEVLKQWQQFCPGNKTIIFAVNVSHSKAIALRAVPKAIARTFWEHYISCEHLDGTTPSEERKAILERFRNGTTQVLTNCAILTEGFDCPDSEAAIIARPTTSVSLWLQMIGRVLRPSPGKNQAIIIDMSDNWFRLGRPCDNRVWSLNPVSCDPDTLGVRCCLSCHHVFKPMPGLIRTKQSFHPKKAEFITYYEVDCPNCGATLRWVLESTDDGDENKEKVLEQTEFIEFKEVPPEVRPLLLRPILLAKRRKFKKEENKLAFYTKTVKDFLLNCQEMNLSELRYVTQILGFEELFDESIKYLSSHICSLQSWEEVTQAISRRPENLKKLVWGLVPPLDKQRITQMKKHYETEVKPWLSSENIAAVADDLEACSDIEMVHLLWKTYNKKAILAALEHLKQDQRNQINQWLLQLDVTSNAS
jgi:superfamily II DNA or RNA helicase